MKISKNKVRLLGSVLTLVFAFLTVFMPAKAASAKTIDINASEYGYGKYIVSVKGVGYDGVYDEDSVLFYYLPVYARAEVDSVTGKHYVDMEYAAYEGEVEEGEELKGEVAKIIINVYDKDGVLVEALSPIEVLPPVTRVEIPFAAKEMPSGTYTISVSAYGIDGDELYKPYVLTTEYKAAEVPDAGAPDTGGLFQNLNISKEDYLVSGLIVFFVLGIVAFGIVARNKKTTPRKHRR